MNRILNIGTVIKAVGLVRPAVEEILKSDGNTWGPKWVEVRIKIPIIVEPMGFHFGDLDKTWNPKWGVQKNFGEIAEAKLRVVMREKVNTSVVVATRPWNLKEGEYLYAGGVAYDDIYVAVSGAKSRVDEAIAEMVISIIKMLVYLVAEEMIREGEEQI